jgi:hypothetical protein
MPIKVAQAAETRIIAAVVPGRGWHRFAILLPAFSARIHIEPVP